MSNFKKIIYVGGEWSGFVSWRDADQKEIHRDTEPGWRTQRLLTEVYIKVDEKEKYATYALNRVDDRHENCEYCKCENE